MDKRPVTGELAVEMRELKALEIAARCRITFDGTVWSVPSQTSGKTYRVTIGSPPTCQCEDFALRQAPCKHIIAARLVCARDHGGKAPAVSTDAVPVRPTYRQNWPAYNKAQMTEKRRLQVLLCQLCRQVEAPSREGKGHRTGRRPTPLCDVLFAMAFKVYSTLSSRRFACDLDDAVERGHMTRPMHPNKINTRMEDASLTPFLNGLITQSSLPLRSIETVFAPDSSGFSTSRFVRWYDEKYGVERSGHDWVKVHLMTGTKTNVVTAVEIADRNAGDCPQFKAMIEATAQNFRIEEVSADKAYLSFENLELVHSLGGMAYIPFKSNNVPGNAGTVWEKMYHYFNLRRDEFLSHYHQRSNVESTFSMIKAKFGDNVRSRTDAAMVNEALCKILCHNICCLIQAHCELGIEPVFWQDEAEEETADAPAILPMIRFV
jgi:transposase